jgi:DNA-binding GntR family transcriptional regulator
MRDVYEARLALEAAAVRRVALGFDERAQSLLVGALEQLERAYDSADQRLIVRGNTAFHASIAAASGSVWLERLIRPTLDASQRFAAVLLQSREETSIEIERRGHEEITAACRAGEADAAEAALRGHLVVFEEQFASALGTGA